MRSIPAALLSRARLRNGVWVLFAKAHSARCTRGRLGARFGQRAADDASCKNGMVHTRPVPTFGISHETYASNLCFRKEAFPDGGR